MKVLVTGGSSLLAQRTAEQLLARGDSVVLFQRRPTWLDTPQVLGDVRDAELVDRAVGECDAVIHLAAKVGVVGSWHEYRSVNVDGTANVVAAARRHSLSRLVHVSTPSVAHAGDALVGVGATPAVTGRKRAWYAESKALGEQLVLLAASDALPTVVIRPHLVWGPGDTQLVGRIIERARAGRLALVGDGAALIDTTYIDNAADALVAALDAAVPGAACIGKPYVIANGEPRPVAELVAGICRAAGVNIAPRHVPRRAAYVAGSVVERLWAVRGADAAEPPLTVDQCAAPGTG
ncbi:MAG: NAD-dependent epimerase/dehydratase family protein [Actinomycetota bacterium]